MRTFLTVLLFTITVTSYSQLNWQNVDSLYQPIPKSVHVYYTNQSVDTASFRAFYVIADLKDKQLNFTTDTTLNRRLTPAKFFEKNASPLVVVNGTFFSFETNRNLNVVIRKGKMLSYNMNSIKQKLADSIIDVQVYRSAIGISKKREADIGWIKTDSVSGKAFVLHFPQKVGYPDMEDYDKQEKIIDFVSNDFYVWKMETAIGGGPILLQNGEVKVTNEYERMFTGKAINDKHPRTAMGYTNDNKLIILVVEGRNKLSGGATLTQEAQILKDLGCVEALNLDGGGSSCLLINGKETITPSDKGIQRAVPAVFIIKTKN